MDNMDSYHYQHSRQPVSMKIWGKQFSDKLNNNCVSEPIHTVSGTIDTRHATGDYDQSYATGFVPHKQLSGYSSLAHPQNVHLQQHDYSRYPIILEDGAIAYVNKNSVDVVTRNGEFKSPPPVLPPQKRPQARPGFSTPKSNYPNIISQKSSLVSNQAEDSSGMMLSSVSASCSTTPASVLRSTSASTSGMRFTSASGSTASSVAPVKKNVGGGRKRPRKNVAKRPPATTRGNGGKREEPKSSQCSGTSNLSVVPSLILIDKSQTPHRTFDRGELLGTGGFAKVFKVVERSSGESFADKVINKEIFIKRANARLKVDREIELHRKMDHVNIIKFYEFFEDTNFVHMVLELAPQGSLLQVSRNRLTLLESEVKYYFKQIAAGTRYIHSQGILHRDLKLGNMFLSEHMTIKIGDFGLSTTFAENKPSLCGTPNYVSPEIIAKKGHCVASEVWSIGCIVYALLCGKPPFDSGSVDRTYHLITSCDYHIPDHLSKPAVEFLKKILVLDPSKRGNIDEPVRSRGCEDSLLNHPFIRTGFIPNYLPVSAVHQAPDFNDQVIDLTDNIDEVDKEPSTGCSPGFTSTLKRMKGFFNSKNDFLDQALFILQQFLSRRSGGAPYTPQYNSLNQIPAFVSKWVDYTNRFGFVYKLSDGSIGVLFNDSTKLGIKAGGKQVEFIDMKGKYFSFSSDENLNNPLWVEVLTRINKLEAYIRYMNDFLNDTTVNDDVLEIISPGQKTLIPQLKRWHRSHSCIGMEFNCNMVQINFKEEHVKILIWMYDSEMFLTNIFANRCQTVSLSSQSCNILNPAAPNLLIEVEAKLKELLAIPIRD